VYLGERPQIILKKMKLIKALAALALAMMLLSSLLEAKSTVVGDILLQGTVERAGRKLANDTSVFEGDSIRTQKASTGILRIARGRVEIAESSEVEIVRGNPLKIVVKSGTVAFNFPRETSVEIITPQLEVRPELGVENLSGIVIATPQTEDRVQSRSGSYTILERQRSGATKQINSGQQLVATLLPTVPLSTLLPDPSQAAQRPLGALGGPQIARLSEVAGDVRVARLAAPRDYVRQPTSGIGLASGDFVATTNGQAKVLFNDDVSYITLNQGTTVQVQEQAQAGTVSRRIFQAIGNLWFNITRAAGAETTLETPTAVAAIRGTEGSQDVPNDTQSTHALNDGEQLITEVVTQQSVTIRSGQRVTAIRGVGFTPIVALIAALTQPTVGAGGAGGGAAGGGAGAGAGAGAAGGAAAGAATAATTTVSAVTATVVVAGGTLATVVATQAIARADDPESASAFIPLNPPGGG
jgi:hypothetical protein